MAQGFSRIRKAGAIAAFGARTADGPAAALSWLGGVRGHRVRALGLEHFGQSGDLPDLYRTYRLDAEAILDAAASLLV